jgi:hypothetical protein
MKKMLLMTLMLGASLLHAELSSAQIQKLNSPLVAERNGTLVIEEYYQINLRSNMQVPFDDKKHTVLIQKSTARMQKGTINKEQFIAIYASVSDRITEEMFLPLLKFGAIGSVEYLTTKPKSYDVETEVIITSKGIETVMRSAKGQQKRFVPFEKLFLIQMQ